MCVIMIAGKERPTVEMVERGWNHNKDGAGIAWRERNDRGEVEVVFQKGVMELPEIQELCKNVPLPYVVHFRVASCGGVSPELTHPFIVSKDVRLELVGRTKGGVLFHNGHWGPWNEKAIDAAIHSNTKVPPGTKWSDSRAMAWMTYLYGPGFMELLTSQKGVLMTPANTQVFLGSGWDKINNVWCSNDYFWNVRKGWTTGNHHTAYRNRLCSAGKCTTEAQPGKMMCKSCEDELEKKQPAGSAVTGVGQSAISIVTGGADRGPLMNVFTMAEVETYHKVKAISKSLLKKYRKAHGGQHQKGNAGDRAKRQLRKLTVEIAEKLVEEAGSMH
jgi:hypothetical protein